MKRVLTVVLVSSFILCGTLSIKIATANTTNNQKVEQIDYDSPLMANNGESLSKVNLQSYDVKDSENISKDVDNYNTDEVNNVYGVDAETTSEDAGSTADNSKKTHTNLSIDENDANYQAPNITYYEPDGSEASTNDTTTTSDDDSYSNYRYSYSTLAKSVMLQTLRNNSEFKKASKVRQEVILYAMQYIGNRYVFGGESITDGIDCSAFTRYVMRHFGKKLPRNSYSQRSVGKSVNKPNTGDLICYNGHVAIYIGDGKIIHASNHHAYPRGGIKVSSSYKYRAVKSIRSLFND